MKCPECKAVIDSDAKFCSVCGAKISIVTVAEPEPALTDPVSLPKKSRELTPVKITDITTLETRLAELKDQTPVDSAIAHALDAQLRVLQIVDSPTLSTGVFDLFIEAFNHAVELSESAAEKQTIRQKAAVMVHSIVFFMEAKLYYEDKKYTEEGLNLLKQGVNMLADSAPAIARLSATGGASLAVDAPSLLNNLTKDRNLLNQVVDWMQKTYTKKHELKMVKMRKDFGSFVDYVIKTLDKERALFGKSTLLSKLISRYSKVIPPATPEHYTTIKPLKYKEFCSTNVGWGFLLTLLAGLLLLVSPKFWVCSIFVSCVALPGFWLGQQMLYKMQCRAGKEPADEHVRYYTAVAEAYRTGDTQTVIHLPEKISPQGLP
jgi:hypothetical protein